MRKSVTLACLLLLFATLSACSYFRFPGVYRLEIQQGNIITQEMIDQLKPGMTKRQVNFVLGTPLIMDTFHTDRWDYLYTLRNRNGETRQEKLTVYFEDDKLTHFDGDFRPTVAAENQGEEEKS